MTNKKSEPIVASEINPEFSLAGSSDYAENFINTLDHSKISELENKVKELKDKSAKKFYAVKISSEVLSSLIEFVERDCEWTQTESLGVIEVYKTLIQTKKEGVKDNTIFLNALPLEALHYFVSKTKGKGLKEAEKFISFYKPLSIALEDIKKDAKEIQDLEKDLTAAQQGIKTI